MPSPVSNALSNEGRSARGHHSPGRALIIEPQLPTRRALDRRNVVLGSLVSHRATRAVASSLGVVVGSVASGSATLC